MKNFLKVSFVFVMILVVLSGYSRAQVVAVNGVGPASLFFELGLGASSSTTGTIHATCLWSSRSDIGTNVVAATDTSTGSSLIDEGAAWVAWTPQAGSCAVVGSTTQIYAYLETDTVSANRCLFDGTRCTVAYPTGNPAPEDLILTGEVALPSSIAVALNASAVNAAGTDIRPEDAEFAVVRALTPCGQPVTPGSQYLGLGYTNGGSIRSDFSSALVHVIDFSLPASYAVTSVGATPIVVVANATDTTNGLGQSSLTNVTSAALSDFLSGTYSYANQMKPTPSATGAPVTVLIPEPLSGDWNVMEYNVPNTIGNKSSQDVGVNQPASQANCSGAVPLSNPMNISTPSSGARKRTVGAGEEVVEANAITDSLGYSFWSFMAFPSLPNLKYFTVDGIDPLLTATSTYTGVVPAKGSAEWANVDLHTTRNGTYPIFSMLRLVNVGATVLPSVANLATSAQDIISFGATSSDPYFIMPVNMTVVHSHFIPLVGGGEPTTAANGSVGLATSACTAPELGGDVGGIVLTLTADSTYCRTHGVTTGQTGMRR
jgi:hypothetical protein